MTKLAASISSHEKDAKHLVGGQSMVLGQLLLGGCGVLNHGHKMKITVEVLA